MLLLLATAAETYNTDWLDLILSATLAVHSILEMAALELSDSFKASTGLIISLVLPQVHWLNYEWFICAWSMSENDDIICEKEWKQLVEKNKEPWSSEKDF